MSLPKVNGLVAVAIDEGKSSQQALKWAADKLLQRRQTVILIHVVKPKQQQHPPPSPSASLPIPNDKQSASFLSLPNVKQLDFQAKTLFLPFRCFCTRKDIQCHDIILEDTDVAKALIEYVTQSGIEVLVMGSSSKRGFLRFIKTTRGIPVMVSRGVPDFCSVYVISNKKQVSSKRNATRAVPFVSPLRSQIVNSVVQPHPVFQPPSTVSCSCCCTRREWSGGAGRPCCCTPLQMIIAGVVAVLVSGVIGAAGGQRKKCKDEVEEEERAGLCNNKEDMY